MLTCLGGHPRPWWTWMWLSLQRMPVKGLCFIQMDLLGTQLKSFLLHLKVIPALLSTKLIQNWVNKMLSITKIRVCKIPANKHVFFTSGEQKYLSVQSSLIVFIFPMLKRFLITGGLGVFFALSLLSVPVENVIRSNKCFFVFLLFFSSHTV